MTAMLDFELYFLSRMRASARLQEETLLSLGLTTAAMLTSERKIVKMGFDELGHSADLYIGVLAEPVDRAPETQVDAASTFAGSTRLRFHLSLWPEFHFLVRAHTDGWAWGQEFVRRQGVNVPRLDCLGDLKPWSFLQSEIENRFGFSSEEEWNWSKDVTCLVPNRPGGSLVEVQLDFDYGLLQSVDT